MSSVVPLQASFAALLAVSTWLTTAPSRAQEPPAAASTTAKAPTMPPLTVWVDARGAELDVERLRASLARELGREVLIDADAGTASVRIRSEGSSRAEVSYTTPSGEELKRTVDLPPNRERSLEVLSWLTVNLVRDEASELLEKLRARREEPPAEGEAPAAASATPEPVPPVKEPVNPAPPVAPRSTQTKPNAAQADTLREEPLRRLDLSLATPLSLLPDSPRRRLFGELSLLYADVGGLRGGAVSAAALRIRQDVQGAAVALGFVHVGGRVEGAVASVGYAQVNGELTGAVAGVGFAWHRGERLRGAVLSVGAAVAGDVEGSMVGVGVAYARSLRGAAATAGVNVVRGQSQGVMLAGGANYSSDFRGFEAAGGLNLARDLDGVAIAPVNVQRRVRGLQLGVINVAEDVSGAAIGVLSVARNGKLQPVLWTAPDGTAHLAVKSVAGHAFTELGAGYDPGDAKLVFGGGAGVHVPLGRFFLEPGVHYSNTQSADEATSGIEHHDVHVLAQGGFRLTRGVELLVAAGAVVGVAGTTEGEVRPDGRLGVAFF